MKLDKLYKKQEELDKHILEKHNIKMSKEELLDNTILALLVEVGELANTTRCFKHWSTKEMMDKEIVLDELADVVHFYLSLGNQTNCNIKDFPTLDQGLYEALEDGNINMTHVFMALYNNVSKIYEEVFMNKSIYMEITQDIYVLIQLLNFTNKEVEQAYLKKHEENYKRQREGY